MNTASLNTAQATNTENTITYSHEKWQLQKYGWKIKGFNVTLLNKPPSQEVQIPREYRSTWFQALAIAKIKSLLSWDITQCSLVVTIVLGQPIRPIFRGQIDNLHWVQALTVPMHLGLIEGSFVPHNLISAQDSPVPLPKFQMTPRLKIFVSSGFKKGTQI